uniref:Uncharacterized protein n=1 Tax=Anguilla anguilla TaxID=7936 RepID=A0A0E9PH84_ANGAN
MLGKDLFEIKVIPMFSGPRSPPSDNAAENATCCSLSRPFCSAM